MKIILFILSILCPVIILASPKQSLFERNGDNLYEKGQYDLARIEYERALLEHAEDRVNEKIALTLIRKKKYRESLTYLSAGNFSSQYLKAYAALKTGLLHPALDSLNWIAKNQTDESGQFEAELLYGAMLIERDLHEADQYYRELLKKAPVHKKQQTEEIIESLKKYKQLNKKSIWLAGSMSAILPGSGQIYASHTADGVAAFLINGFLIGTTASLYDLERASQRPHTASIVSGIVFLFFYMSNITGAAASAKRYNLYEERLLQNEIREKFFHADYAESVSGIRFHVNF